MTKYFVFLSTGQSLFLEVDHFDYVGDQMVFYDGDSVIVGSFSKGSIAGWCKVNQQEGPRVQ